MRHVLSLLLVATLGGCMASIPEPTDDSTEVGSAESALLDELVITEGLWQAAPPGCEGRLSDPRVRLIARTEGDPELRVVLETTPGGSLPTIVCVDTASAIASDRDSAGLPDLMFAYVSTVAADPSPQPSTPAPDGADPSPQPSMPSTLPSGADPSPQPSAPRPAGSDPSPQPSRPDED